MKIEDPRVTLADEARTGVEETVRSGEVSVRGLYGYTE